MQCFPDVSRDLASFPGTPLYSVARKYRIKRGPVNEVIRDQVPKQSNAECDLELSSFTGSSIDTRIQYSLCTVTGKWSPWGTEASF